jgi:aryl-alcohol dehydrogenase-like predicted oxidoreductase
LVAESRQLGQSPLRVPILALGTATFGGVGDFFSRWGTTTLAEARQLVDICLDSGVNFFDTADAYSEGAAEEILGKAIGSRRAQTLIATKVGYRTEPGPDGVGASGPRIIRACEQSLRRLGCDYVDLLQLHGYDEYTPVDETLRAMESLVSAGKVRHIGVSNFSGWHLLKMAGAAESIGLPRIASHQVYYSLLCRDFEHELMPAGFDQSIGTLVWSPLAGGKLTGKIRRGRPLPTDSRTAKLGGVDEEDTALFDLVEVLATIADERGASISQVAINWRLSSLPWPASSWAPEILSR